MIELYGTASPNVYKVSIMLEETGLPYRCRFVDVFGEAQYDPGFLAISPTNRVPVVVDLDGPDGRALPIFESGAILIYLAEKAGKLLSADARERSTQLQWLMFQMASLGPMAGQAVHFTRFAPPGEDYGKERYWSQTNHIHAVLDTRLAASEHLGGEDYSIADVATWPWIWHASQFFPWAKDGGMARLRPNLWRWYEAVSARPGVKAGLAALDDFMVRSTASKDNLKADALDRFLLRGRYSAAVV